MIRYVEANGYMENAALMKPPFDWPTTFIGLFNDQQQSALIQAINQLRDNAERVTAS